MNVPTIEDLIEQVDEMISTMFEHEEACYIPLEVAQQLRDELLQILTEHADDE